VSSEKVFKKKEDFLDSCRICNNRFYLSGHGNHTSCIWEAAQSFPNDKIKRVLEILKYGSFHEGDGLYDHRVMDAIKILSEE